MQQAPYVQYLLVISVVQLILLGLAVYALAEQDAGFSKRIDALEHVSTYRGKDVDGNEVWSAAVTIVEMPVK